MRPTLRLLTSPAPPTVDITRLHSPSLASFTPSNEHLDGAAYDCLKAHMSMTATTPRQRACSLPARPSTSSHRLTLVIALFSNKHHSPTSSEASSPVPSISRTHSSASSSSLPPTPPALPLLLPPDSLHLSLNHDQHTTPRRRTPSLPLPPSPWCAEPSSPAPTTQSLAALEAASKLLRNNTLCAVCGLPGPDFPRCPWCGDAWCSRACRIAARTDPAQRRGHGCMAKRSLPKN